MAAPPAICMSRRVRLHAFTLIEIMVVVVIVGLLAALAIPQFQKIRTRAQDSAVIENARQLATASAQYFLESGSTAVQLSQLVGATNYVKSWGTVAGESYPTELYPGLPITITGIAGSRTITYAP